MKRNEKVYGLLCRLVRQSELVQLQCATTDYLIDEHNIGCYQPIPKATRNAKTKYQFVLHDADKQRLQALVLALFNLDIYQDSYQTHTSDRIQNSKLNLDEKRGTNASNDVILVNNPAGKIKLNQEVITLPKTISCAGLEVRHNMIASIQHTAIVICENYAPMYYLTTFGHNEDLKDALVVYRGDNQTGKKAQELLTFIANWKTLLPIYYLGDFDPAGFNIGFNSFAVDGFLLPALVSLDQNERSRLRHIGRADKYDAQDKQTPIRCSINNEPLHEHINFMNQSRLGFQQEALICNNISIQLIKITKHT